MKEQIDKVVSQVASKVKKNITKNTAAASIQKLEQVQDELATGT